MPIDPAILEQVRNNELTVLNPERNSLTDNDIQQLTEVIPPKSNITSLCLRNNKISATGAAALANCFQSLSKLTNIDLTLNKIGSNGVIALANSFCHLPVLTELELGFNEIDDRGATIIANNLHNLPSLVRLDIMHNKISRNGLTTVANKLRQLPHIVYLAVNGNPVRDHDSILYVINDLCENHYSLAEQLVSAAQTGNIATTRELLQQGVSVHYASIRHQRAGKTALACALEAGHIDIVALFDTHCAFNAYLENQQSLQAEALLATLIQQHPEQGSTYHQQLTESYITSGISYYDQQQWPDALSCFNKALSYQPDNRQAQDYRDRCQQAIIAQPLAADIASLQTTIETLTSDTQALQATTTDLKTDHRHLAEQHTQTIAELQRDYDAKLEAVTEQLATMVESAIHQSHGELTHRVGKLDDTVQQEKKRVRKTIARIDEQLNHLQDAEAKQDVDIADIQQQLEQLAAQKAQYEAELDRLNHNQEHLQQQLNTAMEALQAQLDTIEDNHALHLEEQRQAIHDTQQQIEHLTTQLTQLAEQHQNTATQAQLNDIRNQVNELYADYARKQHHLGRMSLLQNDPSLVAFYCTVQVKLKGIFIAYQSIASHLVEPAKSIIGKIIGHLGSVASLIPDPSAGIVAQVITKLTLLGEKQYTRRQAEHISTIILTTSGSEDLARHTAWLLTQCYELQIRYLTADNGAKQLATGAVGCILYALKHGMLDEVLNSPRINTTEDIARALVQVIAHVDIQQGTLGLRNQHVATLDDPTTTQARHYWTDNGALREAGIYDAEEKAYYHVADSTYPLGRPKKYDYRLGTLAEAQRLANGVPLITRTQPLPSQITRYDTTRYLLHYEAMMADR